MNVMDYLKAGDLFILPSREDPFPLVCLEAAMCGLPVLCFRDAGGMPEFVEEDAGFVVPFEDTKKLAEKIVQLHDDPELRERLGRQAREKVHARHVTPIASPKILSACREISGKAPRVSVIVPNYNYGRFLEKRLDSILQQTFRDYEIILLDDGSTDNSREIIEKFTRSHEARVVINEKNGGSVFKQWYKGLSMARGEFIWMAEADDLAEPVFLERLLPFLNDGEVNLVYCNSHVIDDAGDLQENFYFRTGYYDRLPGGDKWNRDYICSGADEINDGLGIKNIIPNASAVLFRRSAVTDIDQEKLFSFRCGGDWFIYLNTIRNGKLAYCADPLNYHRRHRGSVVGKSVGSAKETIPDYYSIHRYILENFRANEVTLNKQIEYVTVELRQIWPQTTDKAFKKLYDPDELKRFFEENKILF